MTGIRQLEALSAREFPVKGCVSPVRDHNEFMFQIFPLFFKINFFLVVAPKGFIPRDPGIEEAEWVLRDVLFGKNLVVANDLRQWE